MKKTPFELRRLSLGGQITPVSPSGIELSVISQTLLKKSSLKTNFEEPNFENTSKEELFKTIQDECNIYNEREKEIANLKKNQGVRSLQMNLLHLEIEYQKKRLETEQNEKDKQIKIYENLIKLQQKKKDEYLEEEKKINQEDDRRRIHFEHIIKVFHQYNTFRLEKLNKVM